MAISLFLGFILLALATSYTVGRISRDQIDIQQVEQGIEITESFAEQSKLALLYSSEELAAEVASGIADFPGVSGLKIETIEGTVLFTQGELGTAERKYDPSASSVAQLLSTDDENYWTFVSKAELNTIDEYWAGIDGEEPIEATLLGYVTVSLSKDGVQKIQNKILRANILVTLSLAAVLLFILVSLSRRITKPLEKLSVAMKMAEEGDKSVRSELRGPIDIVNMQHAFNTMMKELEKREVELRQARDSALELARMKGEFAANVTHELRTPMNAVLGMMDLLLTMELKSKQKEYVETAKTCGENLLQLIEEILSFSEMESDKKDVEPDDCYLYEILDDVINLLSNPALKKKLDLGYIMAPNSPKAVYVDDAKIRQILINLVGNAIKFTEHGEVGVHVEYLATDENTGLLHFQITDTGMGIKEEDQQKIFEAFRQADSSPTREHGGTGLGLAISKQMIELMGGDIAVSSQPGAGSCFSFSIPLQKTGELELLVENTQSESFEHLRALVVDDSKIVRDFAQQQLAELKIKVTCVESGLEALGLIRQSDSDANPFDVLFVDHSMPGLSADDLLKLANQGDSLRNTLVVILSNPWLVEEEGRKGFVSLPKPLLYSSIHKCLHEHFIQSSSDDHSVENLLPLIPSPRVAKKVLVVDDNRPNQLVACGMLERMGYSTEVVGDGKAAVEAVVRGNFDMVMMDCHMPVLDGYSASHQIRMYEGGETALPIVAMTANSGKEEVQRCFESGMTEFLAKPLRMEELGRMLQKLFPLDSSVNEGEKNNLPEDYGEFSGTSFNPDTMQSLTDNVGEVVNSMIEAFIEDTPVYLRSLKGAVAEGEAKSIQELAHTVKGSAATFGAGKVVAISRDIERLGAAKDFSDIPRLLALLIESYEVLSKDLENKLLLDQQSETESEQYELLIVDDDRAMRMALKNVFQGDIYTVTEAGNGMQAVSYCKRKMPDLVLMDAIMPEVTGFQACELIRELPDGADVPILIITALDNEEAIVEAFKAGATDYVPKPVHFAVMKQRITRLIKASKTEKYVKKLAYHDPLTKLPNRAQLTQQLRLMVNRASLSDEKLAVLFMDLDHFKTINDTLGHDAGDLLLKAVADRLRRSVREQDFIARLGGDEFTVVLEGVHNLDDVRRVASKICESLSQPFVFLQQKMFVSASIGISVFPDHGNESSTLLKHADSAMFSAKKQRNSFSFYEDGMEDELAKRLQLERELHAAIENKEFVLHIQPQMSFKTNKVIAGEALVRWNHPQRGLLGPDQFITLAEETGMIGGIGDWVMEEACRLLQRWKVKGVDFRLAVNLSGRELLGVALQEKLRKLFKRYQVSPTQLELEITESMLMENPSQSEQELRALKLMGITLAVDDFGSGFSSLNYLKRLPVDILKIDRTFIEDIETDPNDSAIVAGIVGLARSLNLDVIAEGIETEGQKKRLAELNCDSFQGYLLSRPVPTDEFEQQFLFNNKQG